MRIRALNGLLTGLLAVTLLAACEGGDWEQGAGASDVGVSTQALIAPAGMGNYCSITWPNGNWGFASFTDGSDSCAYIIQKQGSGGTIQRKGLYAVNGVNRVVYRCYPPGYGWVGIYEGTGNDPLGWAFDA